MAKKWLLIVIALFLLVVAEGIVFSQNSNSRWLNNVEYFEENHVNLWGGGTSVFTRFVNHNSYPVEVRGFVHGDFGGGHDFAFQLAANGGNWLFNAPIRNLSSLRVILPNNLNR